MLCIPYIAYTITKTYHLEELEDSIELCKELIKKINKESMYLYQRKTVLLTGRGGMGKTHLLCDITKQWISNQIPAFANSNSHFLLFHSMHQHKSERNIVSLLLAHQKNLKILRMKFAPILIVSTSPRMHYSCQIALRL